MPLSDEHIANLTTAFADLASALAAQRGGENVQTAPVTAAAGTRVPRAARMAQRSGRARPRPEEPNDRGAAVPLVAAMQAAGLNPGDVVGDTDTLARVMVDVLAGCERNGAPGSGRHVVARARWADQYPAERRLSLHDPYRNTALVSAVCSPAAVLASGGTALPVNVDFSVPTWADANRPFRDGLPSYQADRGGIRFVTPPDIGVPDLQGTASGAGTATRVWTEATDAAPGGQVKPVWTVACGAEQLTYVNAIPTRLQFGNMFGRFAPEQVAANTEVALAVAAREAELELLTLAYSASKQVTPQKYLGAARDLIASIDLLIEQYKYSHRIPDSARFRAVFPSWARGVIRADLARELAHDTSGGDRLAVSDDQIDAWLSVRNIRPLWTEDGVKAGTYGTGGSALSNQFFGLATAGAEPQWPNQASDGTIQLAWLLYPEGTYQFLDGGRLDLGVVRDSTLDATNDYETFVEPFEGLAFRGLESYQVQSIVQPTGTSAGTSLPTYHE